MIMRWLRASSTCLNVSAFGAGHIKPEKMQDLTCSIILRCSIIQNVNTLGMACCHQQTLKDNNSGSCKVSKKLGAIQTQIEMMCLCLLRDEVAKECQTATRKLAKDEVAMFADEFGET